MTGWVSTWAHLQRTGPNALWCLALLGAALLGMWLAEQVSRRTRCTRSKN